MVEKECVKEKEAEIKENIYEHQGNRFKQIIEKARIGKKVLHAKDNPFVLNPQGYIRHLACEERTNQACPNWAIFCHEIRGYSGCHRHQGGFHHFVIKGIGYTTVDGKRFDWKEGDLLLLPIKKGGVEHQHFNMDVKPSRWVALNHLRFADIYGRYREQKEVIPDYTNKKGKNYLVEKEALREREADFQEGDTYDLDEKKQREHTEKARCGIKVLHAKNLPWELNRQGYIRSYLRDDSEGLANNHWSIFSHDIRAHSGKHRHQGGINLFVLKGKGYTTVDGEKFNWKEGDLILLPIKKGGVEHQHFNMDDKPSRWVAFRHVPSVGMIGRFREQKENFPDWDREKS